jgi:hypothetical protein
VKCVLEEAYVLPLNGAKFRFHIIGSFWIIVWISEELLVVLQVHFGGSLGYECTFDFTYFSIQSKEHMLQDAAVMCSMFILYFKVLK